MPRKKKEESTEVVKTNTKKTRKKKETSDNEVTRIALNVLAGRYGSGKILIHRLKMNHPGKVPEILAEVDSLRKTIVK